MRDFRLKALARFERKPMAAVVRRQHARSGLRRHLLLREAHRRAGGRLERPPRRHQEHLREAGHPRGRAQVPLGCDRPVRKSEVVFHRNREDLEAQGVLFCDMDTAVREYPDIVRRWFGTIIPPSDNKFAALNSAVWSGGSFIYVPPGVTVEMPLQAYFRINAENMGQFERTLIIADEGSQVHYIEGCSAPVYTTDSLHSAVVELVALPGSRITYTTIQNWSNNVYNLVTKRARAEAEAHVEWIDGNIGSRLTMKYPSVYLMGPKASGEVLSVAYAGPGQHQDAGAKMVHAAPETSSTIVSKSISKDGGITTYRGLVHVDEGAKGAKSLRPLRRPPPRRRVDLRDQALHGGGRARRPDRPRGHGLQGRRRPALLPDEPGPLGEPGHGDDRERLHRAHHPHPAHGVRRRVEPPDRAADGGFGRLTGRVVARGRNRASATARAVAAWPWPCVRNASTSRAGPTPRARWPGSASSTWPPRPPGAAPTSARPTSAGWPMRAGSTAAWSSRPIEDEPDVPTDEVTEVLGNAEDIVTRVAPDAVAEARAAERASARARTGGGAGGIAVAPGVAARDVSAAGEVWVGASP